MKPVVDDELMDRVSMLAKLKLTGEQKEQAKRDLAEMLDYVACLEKVDVSGVQPLYQVLPAENVFRDDVAACDQGGDWLAKNAPEILDRGFVVPRTIGEA